MSDESQRRAAPASLRSMVCYSASVAIALAVSALMLHLFALPASPIAVPHPPEPALQVTPAADLAAYRKSEAALAKVYAWVDKDKGVVRIPITQAMRRMIERGLDDTTTHW